MLWTSAVLEREVPTHSGRARTLVEKLGQGLEAPMP